MKRVRVHLKESSYDIDIGTGLIGQCGSLLKKIKVGKNAIVITNSHLLTLYKKILEKPLKKSGFTVHFEIVPDTEKAKSARVAMNLLNRISAYDRRKESFIMAFGGGVVGDVAGFVAAVYKRGIPYVQIPTTLLAQVDSAIGGKVAIDLSLAKNLVGAFYQPIVVISDVSLLNSLSSRQIRSGLAEIVKYGVIKDRRLFEYLESNYDRVLALERGVLEYIISRSSEIKARLIEKDPFDKKGIRVILNFGHTIGHAVEAASGYSEKYNHGEAIALGMVVASQLSSRLGLMNANDTKRIEDLIRSIGLPTAIEGLKLERIYEAHLHDKKFIHRTNRFVLPVKIGYAPKVMEDVPESLVRDVLKECIRNG